MKIIDAKGRQDGGSGYTRVLGNEKLGQLISRIQATVISNGTELERIIVSKTNCIDDLDVFINDVTYANKEDGVYLCQKRILKKSKYAYKGIEPDLLIFIVQKKRICKVIELKDGDNFDTKKSESEREHLEQFAIHFGAKIPFITEFYICCFNQEDKDNIREGFKNKFEIEHIMTGRELCETLKIDYESIINQRKIDMEDNFSYFINELLEIDDVKELIEKRIYVD